MTASPTVVMRGIFPRFPLRFIALGQQQMITKAAAIANIQAWLDQIENRNGGWVIVESMTIDRPYGWMFFRATRDYLRTKNFRDIPAGNSAMLCFKDSGKFLFVGTAAPSEAYLGEYESDPPGFLRRFPFVRTE